MRSVCLMFLATSTLLLSPLNPTPPHPRPVHTHSPLVPVLLPIFLNDRDLPKFLPSVRSAFALLHLLPRSLLTDPVS